MVAFGNEVLFNGVDSAGHFTLWETNGTAAGTTEIGGLGDAGVSGASSGAFGLDHPVGMTTLGKTVTPEDFTGNAVSDVLLQNGGGVVDWLMQNGQFSSGNALTNAASGWSVVGTGDFTGSGVSDVLLQNGGTVVDWLLQNGQFSSGNVVTTGAAGWSVVGTGDVNGDGTSDVLLQNGGAVVDWIMKNGQFQSGNVVTTGAAGWSVVGTGDFNGDGTSDVLLQNGGTVVDWIMKNGQFSSGNVVTTGAAGWSVVGTGDYNGDRHLEMVLLQTRRHTWLIGSNAERAVPEIGATLSRPQQPAGQLLAPATATATAPRMYCCRTAARWLIGCMKNRQFSSGNVITTGAAGWQRRSGATPASGRLFDGANNSAAHGGAHRHRSSKVSSTIGVHSALRNSWVGAIFIFSPR